MIITAGGLFVGSDAVEFKAYKPTYVIDVDEKQMSFDRFSDCPVVEIRATSHEVYLLQRMASHFLDECTAAGKSAAVRWGIVPGWM